MSKDIPAISPNNPDELMTYGQYYETLYYKSKNKKKEGELTSDEAEFLQERKKLIDESNALSVASGLPGPISVMENVINFLIDNFLYSEFVNTLQAELDELKDKQEFGILTKRVLNFIEKKMKENEQKNKKLFSSLMEQKTHCYNLRSRTIGWFPTKEMEMAIPEINSDDEDADDDYLPCTIEDADDDEDGDDEDDEDDEDDDEDADDEEIVVNFKANAFKKKGNDPFFEIKLHCDDDNCEAPYILVDKLRRKQPNSGNKYLENSYNENVKIFLSENNKKNFDFSTKKKISTGVYTVHLLRKGTNLCKLDYLSKAKVMTKAEKGKFAVTKKGQTAQDFTYDNEGKLVSKDQKTGTDWAESVKEVSGLMKDPRNFTGILVSSNLQQFQNYYIVNCNYLKRISNREPVNAEKVNEKLSIIRDVQEKLISMDIIPDDAATRKYKSVLQRQKEESKPLLKADHSSVVSEPRVPQRVPPSASGTASVVSSASRAPSASGTASVVSSASRAPSAPPSGSVVSKAHASGASVISKAPSAPSSASENASAVSKPRGLPSKAPSGSVVSKAHASSASKAPSAPPSAFESASAVSKPRGLPSKAPSGYASGASGASSASKAPSASGASRAPSKAPAPEPRVQSVSTIPKSIGTDVQSISNFKSSQKKFQSEYAKAPFAVSEYVDNWYAADSSIA